VEVAVNWVEGVTLVGEREEAVAFGTPGMEDSRAGREAALNAKVSAAA